MLGRTNTGGGGGAGLNFKIVGGTSEPENPKEGTIWVNTDVSITSWIFSATEPETTADDMVWIPTSTSSTIEFNALKKNSIQVYPISAKQYVGGTWVDKIAKIWQGGKWVDLVMWLYNTGDECLSLTGGWKKGSDATLTKTETDMQLKGGSNTYYYVFTTNKIDLTDYTTLHAIVKLGTGTTSSDMGSLGISSNGSSTDGNTKFTNTEYEEVTFSLDGTSGSFYIHVGDKGTGSRTFIQSVWLT